MTRTMASLCLEAPSALGTAAAAIEREWPMNTQHLKTLVADLRRSDERTRFALGVAKAGVWEAELFTGQVEWSETMCLAMGRTQASFDGTLDGMKALLHPEDRDKFARVIHGNFDAPRDFQIEVRVQWPNNTVHHVQFRGQIAPDPGGMSVRLISVAQDVTDQSQLESKLRQAQKMEAMGRLAGGVAHDFNNILTAILGYAVLIEGEPEDQAGAEKHAVQIRKAAERAAALTKQLLAFSRRQVVERRTVYLSDVISDLLPMLGKILGEQVQIQHAIEPDTHPVFADPGQLQQVVLNLAINARDAMPDGGKLSVTATNVTIGEGYRVPRFKMTPGQYVLVTVSDTGTGMDASTRTQIFDPFFTTKGEGYGTGLGLSTVFEIVKGLGGGIRVTSEPGEGTTFQIYLPRTETPVDGATVPSTATLIGGSETVLVVEDEESVRTLVSDILGRKGYTVLKAADATAARAIVAQSDQPIDLVLTDVMMPDGTGPELIDSLRTGAASNARALYMSGYAGAVLAKQGKMAGDCEFLQKPFTGPQLLTKIRHLLDVTTA
ncbi:MAG TPA: ATP-binding protein [Vicinamibacterales bacterium]|nr:ATP-binding protein [Vicinamibacterales bacterium]